MAFADSRPASSPLAPLAEQRSDRRLRAHGGHRAPTLARPYPRFDYLEVIVRKTVSRGVRPPVIRSCMVRWAVPWRTMPNTNAPHESRIGQLRQAAASLRPFDYLAAAALVAATAALVAIYAVGTSIDEGPKTSLDFYRSAATVIPTLLIAVAIQGRVLELSQKISFRGVTGPCCWQSSSSEARPVRS